MSKALPTDAKTERLLNLVLALLGTTRFLKKSEILDVIPGYEGTLESKERMFERDKDELRRIGIPVETSQIDPLFEDEIGYRIPKEKFQSTVPRLNSSEAALATVALSLVSHLGLADGVQRTLMRLQQDEADNDPILERVFSLDSVIDLPALPSLARLIEAIRNQESITFIYERDTDGERMVRHVNPLQLSFLNEDWLLKGWDLDSRGIRTFLVENISELKPSEAPYTPTPELIPENLDSKSWTEIRLQVPSASIALFEVEGGKIIDQSEESATMVFHTFNVDRFLRISLSISTQVVAVEPDSAVRDFEALLRRFKDAI